MTSEKENKELLTKKNQPIKIITQQDINALEITLEQLQSWTSTLEILNKFLILNKKQLIKKIIRKYHANAQIFKIFLNDFLQRTESLEKQLENLKEEKRLEFRLTIYLILA